MSQLAPNSILNTAVPGRPASVGGAALVLLILLAAVGLWPRDVTVPSRASLPPPDAPTRARVQTALNHLPLTFIENQGQTDSQVAYYVQGKDKSVYFTPHGLTFILTAPDTQDTDTQTPGRATRPPSRVT